MNQVGGSGVGGADGLPQHQQMQDVAGLDVGIDPQFVMLRNNMREKILEYIGRKQSSAQWRRRLPELARRLEEILFRKFPSKCEYYNMMKGPIEPQLKFAILTLSAQNRQHQQSQQMSRQIASSSGYGTMIPTPGITQGASGNSRMSYVTDNTGLQLSGAGMVPQNANMGTSLQGEAPDEHVSTLLSLGMNPRRDRSRASNNHHVITIMDTPETNTISPMVTRSPPDPMKEEPKFSCPVCMNELVNASSTLCGHIFCQICIKASIQAQKKCPTCRRKLTMNSFHRVYLPTMD